MINAQRRAEHADPAAVDFKMRYKYTRCYQKKCLPLHVSTSSPIGLIATSNAEKLAIAELFVDLSLEVEA
jgi:hypothetical protein